MPDALEGRHDAGGDEGTGLGRHAGERVEPDGMLRVRRVEDDHVPRPPARDVIEHVCGEVSVRVDHAHAAPGGDVLQDHVPQKGRLAATALPQRQDVLPPVRLRERELRFISRGQPRPQPQVVFDRFQARCRSAGLREPRKRRRPSRFPAPRRVFSAAYVSCEPPGQRERGWRRSRPHAGQILSAGGQDFLKISSRNAKQGGGLHQEHMDSQEIPKKSPGTRLAPVPCKSKCHVQ